MSCFCHFHCIVTTWLSALSGTRRLVVKGAIESYSHVIISIVTIDCWTAAPTVYRYLQRLTVAPLLPVSELLGERPLVLCVV